VDRRGGGCELAGRLERAVKLTATPGQRPVLCLVNVPAVHSFVIVMKMISIEGDHRRDH
jgi:hypothetical protein